MYLGEQIRGCSYPVWAQTGCIQLQNIVSPSTGRALVLIKLFISPYNEIEIKNC